MIEMEMAMERSSFLHLAAAPVAMADGDGEVVLLALRGGAGGDGRGGTADRGRGGKRHHERFILEFQHLGAEPPHEDDDDRGDDPGNAEAVETELGDVAEQDRETHDDETDLDVELGADGGLEPVGDTDGVRYQQTDDKSPESPLEIAVEGELRADETDDNGQEEQHQECRNVLLEVASLDLDRSAEEHRKHRTGEDELAEELPGELAPEARSRGGLLAEGPGTELEGREVEPSGQDGDCAD